LRKSSDPKYQHLNEDLHVEITAFAPPSEAHARIAYALTEVSSFFQFLKGGKTQIEPSFLKRLVFDRIIMTK